MVRNNQRSGPYLLKNLKNYTTLKFLISWNDHHQKFKVIIKIIEGNSMQENKDKYSKSQFFPRQEIEKIYKDRRGREKKQKQG